VPTHVVSPSPGFCESPLLPLRPATTHRLTGNTHPQTT